MSAKLTDTALDEVLRRMAKGAAWMFGVRIADRAIGLLSTAVWISALAAFSVAAGMETLKLFLENRRADPTDALVAAAAAASACLAARRLASWSQP